MGANSPTSGGGQTGPLNPGVVLGNRYLIERLLGGGGMGMVYLARDQRLANRPCAIKEMVDHFIDQAQRIEANEYFAREADTLAQLKHQAIPAITDRFDDQNRHYLVMEYVEGRNLEEELAARGGPLPEGLVVDIARQLCDVLGYLHAMTPPIVYRDMKPSNVMLTPKGRVVLIDFGIARLFKAARKGTMIGTLGFAPPEQYKGDVDPRSDIYSLSATLHFMLSARDPEKFPPFSFPPIRDLRPEISSNVAGAIDAALSYGVDARPQTIENFRDMMLYGAGLSAAPAVSATSGTAGLQAVGIQDLGELVRPPRHPRSAARRAIGLVVFSIALAGIAFGATYIYSDPQLQIRLGIKSMVDSLPWKHEELLAEARQEPLRFKQMTLMLSTREGTPVGSPKASFTDSEIASQRYMKWQATFKNALHGLEGRTDRVEARFYDPNGLQLASSDQSLFVGPSQKTVDFSGVALIPDLNGRPSGSYKVALYLGEKYLAAEQFTVTQDLANKAKAAAEGATPSPEDTLRKEEDKAREEEKRIAMIEERRRHPLDLVHIQLVNSTKTGTALSSPSDTFDVSKVLFVGWEVTFKNRLYKLDTNQYRVDAAYIGPDGRTLGSVNDWKTVQPSQKSITFSGRVGNSAGGAFLPGVYTVNFYLNGQYFAQKRFQVMADTGLPYSGGPAISSAPAPRGPSLSGPTVATGHINGLSGGGSPEMELRLRPQSNGFLHGEMVIHKSGFGTTPIEGFVRGNHIQFSVPYGTDTYYFEGEESSSQLTGTFEATPSGTRGTWTARAY